MFMLAYIVQDIVQEAKHKTNTSLQDKILCRPLLLFRFTSPRCRYNLRIFKTNAVLVKRTLAVSFIELQYKLLVINHPPPQVFVQNLHDFAS